MQDTTADDSVKVGESVELKPTQSSLCFKVDKSLVDYLSTIQQEAVMRGGGISSSSAAHDGSMGKTDRPSSSALPSSLLSCVSLFPPLHALLDDVMRFSSSPLTDFSECFRLFFGSNISIFPYLVYLGGTAGAVVFSIPVGYLMLTGAELQCKSKRVVVDIVLPQLESAEEVAASPAVGDVRLQRHTSISTLVKLCDALWTYPASSPPGGGAVTRKSFVPWTVRILMFVAQYISTCSFAMLLASNVLALVGNSISLTQSLAITCVFLGALLCLITPDTLPKFAAINNVGLMLSTVILIAATVAHANTTSTSDLEDTHAWAISRSMSDFLLFVPILVAYTTPAIFVVDVETNVNRRILLRCLAEQRESVDKLQASCSDTSHHPSPTPVDNVASAAFDGSEVEATTGVIVKRFCTVILVAMVVAFAVLLAFGEFIFSQFTTRTNAVVALSLQPGGFQTALLSDLVVSIFACAALNLDALPQMLDGINTFSRLGFADAFGGSTATVERVVLRAGVMLCVFGTLMLVPFFDLVASLGGCLGLNAFSFFVPIVFRLQAIRRESDSVASGGEELGWLEAARRVPTIREKFTMCVMLALGTAMLISGIANFVMILMQRFDAAQPL